MTKMIRCKVVLTVAISLASTLASAQSAGSAAYMPKCAGCHGTNGVVPAGPAKGMGAKDASDPNIKRLTANEMFASVKNGKGRMPPFMGKLTDEQIRAAVGFYRSLGTEASALTPEQQKSMEDIKSHNAEALKYNEIVKNLNSDLQISKQDIKDGSDTFDAGTKAAKYCEAEALMRRDSQIKPDASILWALLGTAQTGLKKYSEAESSLMKALELEKTAASPNSYVQSIASSGLAEIHAGTNTATGVNTALPCPTMMTNSAVT
jgi:mono/diheme cytochrome c family protein